uniref:Spondin domain-containing protein n=1 Tax=Corethron hystrix TaxID=216773 RepID=A0A7S1BI99_9STRA|mmetsp:Transcript_26483/g.61007  ORF Transcript_26483/g.61007 Transcript_26483/m.61007 type:complete len:229 (+) Transcript_26483:399-1085(+)
MKSFLAIAALVLTATASASKDEVIYKVTFKNKWNKNRHPKNYPSSAHWSPLVVASHSADYVMWHKETLASAGVKQVAETGATTKIDAELSNYKGMNKVHDTAKGSVFFPNDDTKKIRIKELGVSKDHPYVSAITMIAPSPDWITGLDSLKLTDDNGDWLEKVRVNVYPYDAGTDSGKTFEAKNVETNPQANIQMLSLQYIQDNSIEAFVDVDAKKVKPVAKFTLTMKK